MLRYMWYLLIGAAFFGFNKFYQFYYDSTERFIYFKLISHYSTTEFTDFPRHFVITSILLILTIAAILLLNPFQALYEQNRSHGSARYANLKDIKSLNLLKAKGTVLCKWKRKTLYVSEPLSILLLAPPGTGKTAGVAIPTLFKNPHSIIALDVKKELFQTTSKYRSTFSNVMIFEPTSETTSCWNPLDESALPDEFAEIYVKVQQIASNIFIKSESTSDPYWIDSARELFINIAMGLIQRDGGTTIPAVYEASLGDGLMSRKDAVSELGDIESLYEPVAKKLSAYAHTADQQFSGTLGTFDTGLMGFQDPRVKAAVSKCDIDFHDLRGIEDENGVYKPVTLYLVIKPIDIERLSPLIRVFFESLSKYLLSTEWDKSKEHMITFLLDEFPRLGAMEDIIKMPALSRGQGVNSILIAQDAGQIERVYKKSGREEIMSTTAYKVIPSQNSFESARLISDSVGDMTMKSNSTSHSNAEFLKANISKREQGKKLLSPQSIMSLKFGKCFIVSQFASETPIKGELYLWFKDKKLLKLAGELEEENIFRPGNVTTSSMSSSSSYNALSVVSLPSQDIIDQNYSYDSEEPSDTTHDGSSESINDHPDSDDPVDSNADPSDPSIDDNEDFSSENLLSPSLTMESEDGNIAVTSEISSFEEDEGGQNSFSQSAEHILDDSSFSKRLSDM